MEVGLSFSDGNRTHSASMKYASKRMERLHQQKIRQHCKEGSYRIQDSALPIIRHLPTTRLQQRLCKFGVNITEQRERVTSAPSMALSQAQLLSPVSPLTALPETPRTPSTFASEMLNKPLPPTPSQFRLGDADTPLSMNLYYVHELETPIQGYWADDDDTLLLDERAARDLEALHLAMLTVDSLDSGAWAPTTWRNV